LVGAEATHFPDLNRTPDSALLMGLGVLALAVALIKIGFSLR
jgi:hypothetical protein